MKKVETIDEYIADFPEQVQQLLESVRQTIRKAAPEAKEAIAYGIPTFKMNGNLVHFGGFKSHVGFYPAPSGLKAFDKEIAKYAAGKGSVQFPYDQPIPHALITKIVKYRVTENKKKP